MAAAFDLEPPTAEVPATGIACGTVNLVNFPLGEILRPSREKPGFLPSCLSPPLL